MRSNTRYLKLFVILGVTLVPAILLVGCRGNLGWSRVSAPVGQQNQTSIGHLQ